MSLPISIDTDDHPSIRGGGNTGALIRATDWSTTTLGAMSSWPQALLSALQICINTPNICAVHWGDDLKTFYNDSYAAILSDRHPAMGQPFSTIWEEVWDVLAPQIEAVRQTGQGFSTDHQLLQIVRDGQQIDTHWIYSFAPIYEGSAIAGIFTTAVDITEKVNADRRVVSLQQRQDRMLQQIPGFIGILSAPELCYSYVNNALVRLSKRTDLIGCAFADAFHDLDDAREFTQALEATLRETRTVVKRGIELRRGSSTAPQYVDFVVEPILSEEGKITDIFFGGYETTEVHASSIALRANEARLQFYERLAAETATFDDASAVLAATTRLVGEYLGLSVCAYADMDDDENGFTIRGDWAAPGATSIVGHYSLADFGQLAVKNLSAGLPLVVNDNLRELAPEEAATFQNIGIAATICMPLVKNGRLTALMAIHDKVPRVWTDDELNLLREVTSRSWSHVERVATVAALGESEERLRLAVENAEIGFWDVDTVNDILIWPPRTKAMFGISADVPVTMQDFYDGLHPEDAASTSKAFALAADPSVRALYDVEYRTIGKEDGVIRWVAAKGRGMFDTAGRCLRVAGTAIDITLRKAAELALLENEARLKELNDTLEFRVTEALAERRILADVIEGTDIMVQVADQNFNWLAINSAAADEFARLFEVKRPKAGDNMLDVLSDRPADQASVKAVWSRALNGEDFVEVDEFGDPSIARRYYEMRFRTLHNSDNEAMGAYQFVSDVTDRLREQHRLQEAEEALRQSQKMEAMGQLTGGVAHDFNNLLTPIIGSLDMLTRRGSGTEREMRLIDGALQSAERAKTLVQRLLAFARRQPLQPINIAIDELVEGMAGLIVSTLGPTIHVQIDFPPNLPPAKADPNQLEMALLNLAVNARDAMPTGGKLSFSGKFEMVEYSHPSGVKPGRYVVLRVEDTGAGMDSETRHRAIEPFFSTKGIGKGTGLGLSMVHGLVGQLGGGMIIESSLGEGTAVELWLPVSNDKAIEAEPSLSVQERTTIRGKVLLVDDDDLVRMSTADMLVELGFSVIEAASSDEALDFIRSQLVPNILVTDHLMPSMTGVELAREANLLLPDLPILVISGYSDIDGIAADLGRLGKPFKMHELDKAINDLL